MLKRLYNEAPTPAQPVLAGVVAVRMLLPTALRGLSRGKSPGTTFATRGRGMSAWYDLVDWVGGYPFEVAKPEEVFDFCRDRGLELQRLKTCGGGHGCNEFVFARLVPHTGRVPSNVA